MSYSDTKNFAIFRAAEAPLLETSGIMSFAGITPVIAEGFSAFEKVGDGSVSKLLFEMPGFSLVYAWFKSGFPLPLHTHNSDCLYIVIAGALKLGTERLERGDGFFVPTDVPYAYTPCEDGVEVLEFRAANQFDIRFMAKNATAWKKVSEKLHARKPKWANELAPIGLDH